MTSNTLLAHVRVSASDYPANPRVQITAEVSLESNPPACWLLPHEIWLLGEEAGLHKTSRGDIWVQHLESHICVKCLAPPKTLPDYLRKALSTGVNLRYEDLDGHFAQVDEELQALSGQHFELEEVSFQGSTHPLAGRDLYSALDAKYDEFVERRFSRQHVADSLDDVQENPYAGGKTGMKFAKTKLPY